MGLAHIQPCFCIAKFSLAISDDVELLPILFFLTPIYLPLDISHFRESWWVGSGTRNSCMYSISGDVGDDRVVRLKQSK